MSVDYYKIERKTYDTTKFIVQQHLCGHLADKIDMQCRIDEANRMLIVKLKLILAKGHTLESFEMIEFPVDWWQHFKQRWFDNRLMRWHLRWKPVKLIRIPKTTSITRVCPHLPMQNNYDGKLHFDYLDGEI